MFSLLQRQHPARFAAMVVARPAMVDSHLAPVSTRNLFHRAFALVV
jgi:hypothetical protein